MKSTVTDYRYFEKNLDSLSKTVISLQEPRIQKHDQLNITVSSATLNQEQTVVFNLTSGGGAGGVSGGGGSMGGAGGVMGYLVDYDGTISLPIVGKVMAEGLTKNQLADTLVKRLEPYVKNPILNIRFLNYRVMLIGETRQQGWVTFSNEKATIVDAIMQGGGLTDQGERSGILLIRTQPGGQVETHRLDMNDAMIYQSPYFQLQQNDIIYVLPNESRLLAYQRSNSPFFRDLPLYLGLITSILAFATLIISLTQ
jgi:polysaccharide export outer membrane protein